MLRAEEYRRYAADCWRRGREDPQLRETLAHYGGGLVPRAGVLS
jgi:hypothetical protein